MTRLNHMEDVVYRASTEPQAFFCRLDIVESPCCKALSVIQTGPQFNHRLKPIRRCVRCRNPF